MSLPRILNSPVCTNGSAAMSESWWVGLVTRYFVQCCDHEGLSVAALQLRSDLCDLVRALLSRIAEWVRHGFGLRGRGLVLPPNLRSQTQARAGEEDLPRLRESMNAPDRTSSTRLGVTDTRRMPAVVKACRNRRARPMENRVGSMPTAEPLGNACFPRMLAHGHQSLGSREQVDRLQPSLH